MGKDGVKAIVIVDHGSTVLVVRTEDVGHQRVYRYSKIRRVSWVPKGEYPHA